MKKRNLIYVSLYANRYGSLFCNCAKNQAEGL